MERIHITLVGREALPVYYPIHAIGYDRVFLIATRESMAVAKTISKVANEHGHACSIYKGDIFSNDTTSSEKACESLHSEYPDADFSYNLTGGNKLMALGAFITASRHHAEVFYTDGDNYIDLVTNKTRRFCSFIDIETLFALQGQRVKKSDKYEEDNETYKSAITCEQFVKTKPRLLARLRDCYEQSNHRLPPNFETDRYVTTYSHGCLSITDGDKEILHLEHPDALRLLLGGRWWEVIVAKHVDDWAVKHGYEMWTNVMFAPKNTTSQQLGKVKNEIDILVKTGNLLLFVECKSGNVSQENIAIINYVRTTYGSEKSRSVLISYHPVGPDVSEKARDTKLSVISPLGGADTVSQIALRLDSICNAQKT